MLEKKVGHPSVHSGDPREDQDLPEETSMDNVAMTIPPTISKNLG